MDELWLGKCRYAHTRIADPICYCDLGGPGRKSCPEISSGGGDRRDVLRLSENARGGNSHGSVDLCRAPVHGPDLTADHDLSPAAVDFMQWVGIALGSSPQGVKENITKFGQIQVPIQRDSNWATQEPFYPLIAPADRPRTNRRIVKRKITISGIAPRK